MKGSCFTLHSLLAAVGAFLFCSSSTGQEAASKSAETSMVVRISREFVRRHNLPPIDEVGPIHRCLLGAHVRGQLHTTGATTVRMDIDQSDAVFIFHISGTTVAHSVATREPVEVFSTAQTNFEGERPIRFNGLRFAAEPAIVQASYSACIEGLATPEGLRGRIIRRRAWPQIEANAPLANEISFNDAKARIAESFDRQTDLLVATLNRVVPLEQTAALVAPQTKDWIVHVGRTKTYILVSPGLKDAAIPSLPKEAESLQAPLELWVRAKENTPSTARLLELYGVVDRALDQFRLPVSAKEKLDLIADLKFTKVGDWTVVKVGEDLLETMVEKVEQKAKSAK